MDALLPTELRRHSQIVKLYATFAIEVRVYPYHGCALPTELSRQLVTIITYLINKSGFYSDSSPSLMMRTMSLPSLMVPFKLSLVSAEITSMVPATVVRTPIIM